MDDEKMQQQQPHAFPFALADYLLSQDKFEELEALCGHGLQQQQLAVPNSVRDERVLLLRAFAIGQQGDKHRACQKLDRLLNMYSSTTRLSSNYVLLKFRESLRESGDSSAACSKDACAELESNLKLAYGEASPAGLVLAGRLFLHMNRFKKAMQCFKQAATALLKDDASLPLLRSVHALQSWTVIAEIIVGQSRERDERKTASSGPPKLNKRDSKVVTREIRALQAMADEKKADEVQEVWVALLVAYELVSAPEKALEALFVLIPLLKGVPQVSVLEEVRLGLLRAASSKLAAPPTKRASSCQLDDADSSALFVPMTLFFNADRRKDDDAKHATNNVSMTSSGRASSRAKQAIRTGQEDNDPAFSSIYHPPAARTYSKIVPSGSSLLDSDSKKKKEKKSKEDREASRAIKVHAAKKARENREESMQSKFGRNLHFEDANERAQRQMEKFKWANLSEQEQNRVRQKAMEFLTYASQGQSFVKHGRNGSPHERVVRMLFDNPRSDGGFDTLVINWTSNKLRLERSQKPYVLNGKQTAVLLRSVSENTEEKFCFSVASCNGGRTVDLEAREVEIRKLWVQGLRCALQYCFREPAEEASQSQDVEEGKQSV